VISQNTFINSQQDYSVYGAEIELQWRLAKNWQLNAFISQAIPTTGSEEATRDIAQFKSNLSITGIYAWFTINLMRLYHSDISGDIDYISRFDINISQEEGLFINNMSTYLKVVNVFSQDNYHSIDSELGNPLPGRTVEVGVSYKF